MVTFFWIIFDAAISVRMMTTGYPFWEVALWFVGGLALAVGAWIAETKEKKADSKKMTDLEGTIATLRQELSETRNYQSGKLDVIALLGGETFRHLQNLTQTTDQPVARTIEITAEKFELLEHKVSRHEAIFWGAIAESDKQELVYTLTGLGSHTVQITAGENTDCVELAHDLRDCFRRAGWSVARVPITGTWGTAGASGFSLTTKYGKESLHRFVFDALQKAIAGPLRGISGGPPPSSLEDENKADFSILVGPKRIHADD
jgi:hypothetical protein